MKFGKLFTTVLMLGLTTACTLPQAPDYTDLLASSPKSILVMMPRSQASDISAGPSVLANITLPLTERGYYVFPVALVNDTFRYNGITEAAEMRQVSFKKLHEIYGADAVLDLNVEDYSSHFQLLDSIFIVQVHAALYDLKTEKLLWQMKCSASNGGGGQGGHPLGILFKALIKHAFNNMTDQGYKLAQQCTVLFTDDLVVGPLLRGPYSQKYHQDPVLSKTKK